MTPELHQLSSPGRGQPRDDGADRGWQSIGRALSLLEYVATHDRALPVEISEALELKPSTVHRIAKALETRGYLTREPRHGALFLGPTTFDLARSALGQVGDSAFVAQVMPYLEELKLMTGESVGLHVAHGLHRVCIAEVASDHPMRMVTGVGSMHALERAAAGKALLAFGDQDTIDSVTSRKSPDVDRESLLADLEAIRKDGIAISFGETVPGAAALALPVIDGSGRLRGAVNVTGPEIRWNAERIQEALPGAREVVARLTADLGRAPR